jgi:hypothetical protein
MDTNGVINKPQVPADKCHNKVTHITVNLLYRIVLNNEEFVAPVKRCLALNSYNFRCAGRILFFVTAIYVLL